MTDEEVEALARYLFELSNQYPFTWEGNLPSIRQLWRNIVIAEYQKDPEGVRRQLDRIAKK